jgi:hypothetical protein
MASPIRSVGDDPHHENRLAIVCREHHCRLSACVHWLLSSRLFSVRAMYAQNGHLLSTALIAAALMPATLAGAADMPLSRPMRSA